jgi:AcrR family transcriptional regulator
VTKPAPSARRADALHNRARLLDAARDVFGERGLDAPLDEIAQRAGLGNATLYRHFADRCALVAAVFTEQVEAYAAAAREAEAAADAGAGLREYIRRICAIQADNRALADLLTSNAVSSPHLDTLRLSARRNIGRVIRRAQRDGTLRADFRPQDIALILMANSGVVRRTFEQAPESSARVVGLLLDGLAPSAASAGSAPAPIGRADALAVQLVGRHPVRGRPRGRVGLGLRQRCASPAGHGEVAHGLNTDRTAS